MHNVKSNNNTGHGAFLSNTAGNGNITIDSVSNDGSSGSSEFNGNTKDGLSAFSNGDITLTDVTADGDQNLNYDGAYLDNSSGSGAIRVDNSTFNNNTGGDGLTILSNGDITLTGVTADNNYDDGVYLDNTSGSGNISVDNTSGGDFSGNNVNGLKAYSNGNVGLTYVTADDNYYDGALLGDYYNYVEVGGDITVTGGISVTTIPMDIVDALIILPVLKRMPMAISASTVSLPMTIIMMVSIWITLSVPATSALRTTPSVILPEPMAMVPMVSRLIPMGISHSPMSLRMVITTMALCWAIRLTLLKWEATSPLPAATSVITISMDIVDALTILQAWKPMPMAISTSPASLPMTIIMMAHIWITHTALA